MGGGRPFQEGSEKLVIPDTRVYCVDRCSGAVCNVRACTAVHVTLTEADCRDVTLTYRCSNQRCIPRQLVNNSVNDCVDNSDEGITVITTSPIIIIIIIITSF